ncbi:MAG TPA: extracellular solute-binding protein, partial [Actinomycetes bacterium]|nr:extracellular solute-binding protein [Actinomycetes bacterium]
MSRKTIIAALALLLALGSAGCGSDRDALTIYSGRTQNLIGPLLERFNKETGIAIDVKYGDSAELALLLDEEGDRTPADLFLSQSPGATGFLAGKGHLGQLDAAVLGKVDQRFRNADGRWVGVSGRQRGLVYNSDEVTEAELPDSVLDLTDDRFAGKVAVALALLLVLTAAGCSRSRDALTVYSGRTQNLIGPLLERFNRETGIA